MRGGGFRPTVQIRSPAKAPTSALNNAAAPTGAGIVGVENGDGKMDDAGADSEDAAEFVMEGTQKSLPTASNIAYQPPVQANFTFNQQRQPCRFGDACTRMQCTFLHPWEMVVKTRVCRFADACQAFRCAFWHPWDGGEPPVSAAPALSASGSVSAIPCRFGAMCNKVPNCPFKHDMFTGHKTLVLNAVAGGVRAAVSERVFAVADSETEKVLPEGAGESSGVAGSGGVTVSVQNVVLSGNADEELIDEDALL